MAANSLVVLRSRKDDDVGAAANLVDHFITERVDSADARRVARCPSPVGFEKSVDDDGREALHPCSNSSM